MTNKLLPDSERSSDERTISRGDVRVVPDVTVLVKCTVTVMSEHAVEPFRITSRLSETEQAMLMGGACAMAHGRELKKI
jgi:hypothetical protein